MNKDNKNKETRMEELLREIAQVLNSEKISKPS